MNTNDLFSKISVDSMIYKTYTLVTIVIFRLIEHSEHINKTGLIALAMG